MIANALFLVGAVTAVLTFSQQFLGDKDKDWLFNQMLLSVELAR